MALRIAVANHKGGVAKSTTSMMLAEGAALICGARVLVIDFDPQSSLSAMFLSSEGAIAAATKGRTLWHLLNAIGDGKPIQLARFITTKVSDLSELRTAKDHRRVDLIASWSALLKDARKLDDAMRVRFKSDRLDETIAKALRSELDSLDRSYDLIVMDCPAGPVTLALSAIRLSQIVLAPTSLDEISLRALSDFVKIILAEDLGVYGHLQDFKVLMTQYHRSNPEQKRLYEQIAAGVFGLKAVRRPIAYSTQVHRATTRLRPDSYRSAKEKYGDTLEDVATMAQSVLGKANCPKRISA